MLIGVPTQLVNAGFDQTHRPIQVSNLNRQLGVL